jgi:hypothetical protein
MESKKVFTCQCGTNTIALSFKGGMPQEVVDRVFCPGCAQDGALHGKAWPIPGNWYLHFNMEIARMFGMAKLGIDPGLVNPGFIIDGGYVE